MVLIVSISFTFAETLVNFTAMDIFAVPFDQREDMAEDDMARPYNFGMLEGSVENSLTDNLDLRVKVMNYMVQTGLGGMDLTTGLIFYESDLRFEVSTMWKISEPGNPVFNWAPEFIVGTSYSGDDFTFSALVNTTFNKEDPYSNMDEKVYWITPSLFFEYFFGDNEDFLKSMKPFVNLNFTNQEFPTYDTYGNITDWGTAAVTVGGGVDFSLGSGLMFGVEFQPDYWANLEGSPMYALKVRMGYSFSSKL
jgi:hypothetical protein